MNLLAWLISLVLPACGFPGAEGLPTPLLMDVAHIVRPSSQNTALAGPAGSNPSPDIVTPHYQVAPDQLFALVREVAASQPRTFQAALYPEQLQAHYVARSAAFNFPDLVTVQVLKGSADGSDLVVYSRSVYGESDLGVNRKRIAAWLAELQIKLPQPSER